jgi:hypothetical protein
LSRCGGPVKVCFATSVTDDDFRSAAAVGFATAELPLDEMSWVHLALRLLLLQLLIDPGKRKTNII